MKLKLIPCLLLLTLSALAAEVTGKWTGSIEGPQGQMELTFNFKQDGDKLTGTSQTPMGEMAISEGKVDGDKITFTVANDQFKVLHKGTISGDELKLKIEIGEREMEMTAKRAK